MTNANGYGRLEALAKKWLPHQAIDEDTLGQALFLEQNYWQNMEITTQNAVYKAIMTAFKGKK